MKNLEDQRRIKRFHSKVRTGCTTCKKRRIKCDETRPTCGACERASKQCVYVEVKSWVFEPSRPGEGQIVIPKVRCGPTPLHLPVTKESLDFRFFLEHSVPLLCTVSDDWDSHILSQIPSLFVAGEPLIYHRRTAFGRFWNELVPKIAYEEPVIYNLICLYASRHRAAICSAIVDNPISTLEYYGKAIKKLSLISGKASPHITITGAMILFAFDRMVTSIHQPSTDGLAHVLACLSLMMQYPTSIVQDFLIPTSEHFTALVSMFQQHCAALTTNSTCVVTSEKEPYLPQSFNGCKEASQYFFDIIKAKYPCDCLEGSSWTEQCSAFQQQQVRLKRWRLRMQEYYLSVRGSSFDETKAAFTLLAEVNLVMAAVVLSVNENFGTAASDINSVRSTSSA